MSYARRSCGESSLGPGFESPRLHCTTKNGTQQMDALFSFRELEMIWVSPATKLHRGPGDFIDDGFELLRRPGRADILESLRDFLT